MKLEEMKRGGRYNWKHQSERLIYLGPDLSNGWWYQFALVDKPTVCWCEVRALELEGFENTPTKELRDEPKRIIETRTQKKKRIADEFNAAYNQTILV